MIINVLLVEDVQLAQKLAKMTLERLSCDVDIAATGINALELIEKKQFDIILMDLGLPDIDGPSVTQKIRQSDSINKNTPIVALTANDDDEYKKNSLDAGMNDFLRKPLTEGKATSVLEKYTQWKK